MSLLSLFRKPVIEVIPEVSTMHDLVAYIMQRYADIHGREKAEKLSVFVTGEAKWSGRKFEHSVRLFVMVDKHNLSINFSTNDFQDRTLVQRNMVQINKWITSFC